MKLEHDAAVRKLSETKLFGRLSYREREILKMWYGLNGSRQHTLEEIAWVFKATRERVRQIARRGIEKLIGMAAGTAKTKEERRKHSLYDETILIQPCSTQIKSVRARHAISRFGDAEVSVTAGQILELGNCGEKTFNEIATAFGSDLRMKGPRLIKLRGGAK